MNKVIGIGMLGLLIYGAIRISKVKNVADSITTKLVNPRIHKISLSGMILRTEVKINNPTADGWSIQFILIIFINSIKCCPEFVNRTF